MVFSFISDVFFFLSMFPRLWCQTYRKVRREMIGRRQAIRWTNAIFLQGDTWIDAELHVRFLNYMAKAYGPDDNGFDLIDSYGRF